MEQIQQIDVQSVYGVLYFYIPSSSVAGKNITFIQNCTQLPPWFSVQEKNHIESGSSVSICINLICGCTTLLTALLVTVDKNVCHKIQSSSTPFVTLFERY